MQQLISAILTALITFGAWLGIPCQVRGPERMTDEQAKILAADLLEQAYEVFSVYYGGIPGDHEDMGDGTFRVGENPYGIHSIADVKAFIEKTYTKEFAQEHHYASSNDPTECGMFFEKDGELYFRVLATGIGSILYTETAKVISQTKDKLIITLDRGDGGDDPASKIRWNLKWEDNTWKLDCWPF